MRSPRCGRSSRGRPGAPARCSSRRWSGTWPRPSASVTPSSPSSPGRRRESARSPTGAGAGSSRTSNWSWPGRPARTSCAGGCATIPRGSRSSSRTTGCWSTGDRELPRRAAARRRGPGASATWPSSTSGPCRRAAAAVHLPDLRRAGRRRAGAAAGRAAARESERRYRDLYEEAPIAYVDDRTAIDGSSASTDRATQMLGITPEELVGRPVLASLRRHARRPGRGPRRRSARHRPARRPPAWSWRCAARDGGPALGQRVDGPLPGPTAGSPAVHSIWVDITDRVLAEAGDGPPPAAEPLPPGRDQVGPQLRGDRRPQPARCSPCSTRSAGSRRPTPPSSSPARPGPARS